MSDALVFVDDVEHGDARDGAGIEWLPAGCGIEGGAVQVHGTAIVGAAGDARREAAQVGIGVVEAFSHGDTAILTEGRACENGVRLGKVEETFLPKRARSSAG